MNSKYTLYGAEFSLYSGKVRAYLRYKNIAFDEVLSTAKVYKKIIIPNTGVKFIPVVKTPEGDYLQDTSHIIDTLEKTHPDQAVYPTSPKQRLVSLLLEMYGDEWLLIPAMHYRWNFDNLDFIYKEFGNIISPKLPGFIRGFVGKKIGSRFKNIVPLLGVTQKTIPAIEHWYENEFLASFNHHLSEHDFLLGSAPSIADFGFFGPLYAHLYRDPYPGQLMKKIAPNVAKWVERMKDASSVKGKFLEQDEIPETLYPILKNLFATQWPVLEDTAAILSRWYCENKSDSPEAIEFPRRLAMHNFTFAEVEEQRMVLSYSQWMMQRPLSFYQSLSSQDKESMQEFIKAIDAEKLTQCKLDTLVSRENNVFKVKAN